MKVAIIGAGPAGLTAGYQLAAAGVEVIVFEAGPEVGGMARSFDLWGQRVDLGSHRFFSKDPRVNRLWLDIMGRDYRMVRRQSRILYRRRLYDYPLRLGNALANMGLARAAACIASYATTRMKARLAPSPEITFEDWVVARFGRKLFEMFFKSYSEKLWGIRCSELSADFAAQRIKSFSLAEALRTMTGLSSRSHRTLVDSFAYPTSGNGEVYERMSRAITAMGGRIRLSTPVNRVQVERGVATGIVLADGEIVACDHVVSTMPLTTMVRSLADVPDAVLEATRVLRFRNTILVYLQIAQAAIFPDQWLYIHSPELGMGRVTNFRNWAPEICRGREETILALEYWCDDSDADWSATDDTLADRARREIAATGLVLPEDILQAKVVRVPRCYPVYSRDYKSQLAPIVAFLKTQRNLWPIGRYGAFKYNNQDHSILMGILAAETILGRHVHDLWQVNADDEYHESSTITAAGLVVEPIEAQAAS
ncbi:FAD-dependent oxidoreductase [Bradyrhizobium sp.]|uniref:FAD-dependent oxidoreductase n=1 Tax=Bradyrhizobium sp. TaxID=376 RepID=UPI0039E27D18